MRRAPKQVPAGGLVHDFIERLLQTKLHWPFDYVVCSRRDLNPQHAIIKVAYPTTGTQRLSLEDSGKVQTVGFEPTTNEWLTRTRVN